MAFLVAILLDPFPFLCSIALVASKTFVFEHLLNEDGQGPLEVLEGDKLH